jgi:hypothetical protein
MIHTVPSATSHTLQCLYRKCTDHAKLVYDNLNPNPSEHDYYEDYNNGTRENQGIEGKGEVEVHEPEALKWEMYTRERTTRLKTTDMSQRGKTMTVELSLTI